MCEKLWAHIGLILLFHCHQSQTLQLYVSTKTGGNELSLDFDFLLKLNMTYRQHLPTVRNRLQCHTVSLAYHGSALSVHSRDLQRAGVTLPFLSFCAARHIARGEAKRIMRVISEGQHSSYIKWYFSSHFFVNGANLSSCNSLKW